MAVESIVAIGYPAEAKAGHPAASLELGKVSYDRYGRHRTG
jgi:hypothetical protein